MSWCGSCSAFSVFLCQKAECHHGTNDMDCELNGRKEIAVVGKSIVLGVDRTEYLS